MKIKKVTVDSERRILIGMIMSDQFLRAMKDIYRSEYFKATYSRQVAKWCLEHYERYEKAPQSDIETIFKAWMKKAHEDDEDDVDLIAKLLSSLSDEFDQDGKFNVEYHLDLAVEYMKSNALKNLVEEVDACVLDGDIVEAETLLKSYDLPEKQTASHVNPFASEATEKIIEAFESKEEPLFYVPGALGYMLNEHMVREGLVSFLAPMKRGKTWLLMQLMVWAIQDNCNVAFFQCGDLSEADFLRRLGIYFSKRSDRAKYCGEFIAPVLDCAKNQSDECSLRKRKCDFGLLKSDGTYMNFEEAEEAEYLPCSECKRDWNFVGAVHYKKVIVNEPLTGIAAAKTMKKQRRRFNPKRLRVATYSNSKATISRIESDLDRWEEEENWIADVVIIDYADLLENESVYKEYRHQENAKWKRLRRIPQDRHNLLITVTQSDAKGYQKTILTADNFNEDRRKLDHATAFFAINQLPEEKKKLYSRISVIAAREGEWNEQDTVTILQNIRQGRPIVGSFITHSNGN